MNPQAVFCPNIACPARGQQGKGNIGVHSRSEERYICHACGHTFSASKGTLFYRLRTDSMRVLLVITLLAVDGLVSYVSAFQAAFRSPLPRHGQPGRPRLVAWPNITIVQVVKRRTAAGLDIVRRIVQGSETLVARLLHCSQGGGVINTAYIERLNATFRQRLACLARRTRYLVQEKATLTAGMFIVGCFYNFCDEHESLRKPLWITQRRHHWVQRTPAMAAGLTDHCWTPTELFAFKVPPPPWSPPTRRGRPSKQTLALVARWCS